ncbi:MAG: hypothetical protein KJZ87_09685 [Thermoguttaceae bacterium]|nr:hypothetical protein [Thermoguttaceae bacterium]
MRQTLLVQLPIPPPGHQPVEGNVPLAAAYLKLLARRRGLERRFGTEAVNCPMETRNEMYKHEYWTTTIGFLAATLLLAQAAVQAHAAEPVSLDDGRLRIAVDSARGSLDGLIDLAADHDHAAPADPLDLWTMRVGAAGETVNLAPADARSFRAAPIDGRPHALRLEWSDFSRPGLSGLAVVATVELGQKPRGSQWSIAVEGLADATLEEVRFPRIPAIAEQQREFLAVPVWMGRLMGDPRKLLAGSGKGSRMEWHYPGILAMQCVTYYGAKSALYIACDDTAAFRKSFAFWGDGAGRVNFEMVHLPEQGSAAAGRWQMPYRAVVDAFEGDWITAAEQYRAWATEQPWAAASRRKRGQTPEWVDKTALWVWNRGRSPGVLEPAARLQDELGLPVSVFWHWWHGCSYDTGFPEYLPPREGADPFRAAVARASGKGLHTLVYMNQRLWGTTTASWAAEGAERYAVKGADGKIHPEVYNTFTKAPCAPMCMGTSFWRDKYAGIAAEAFADLGVDGIYMDQACASLACYDRTHGHPIGGGKYWMEGFQSLAADLRSRTSGPREIALAGEGVGEPWLPHLDLMLSLEVSIERYQALPAGTESIPFFHAVYHPYTIQFGNYSSLTIPPYDDLWPPESAPPEPLKLLDRQHSPQFYLDQARAFVWGQQPTLANFIPALLRERKEEVDYALELARVRHRALKYLLDGTFLRAPPIDVPAVSITPLRLSIYARPPSDRVEPRSYPAVLSAAWKAKDGDVAVALASIADHPVDVSFTLDRAYYGLPARGEIRRIDQSGAQTIGSFAAAATAQLTLPARRACLIEFTPR